MLLLDTSFHCPADEYAFFNPDSTFSSPSSDTLEQNRFPSHFNQENPCKSGEYPSYSSMVKWIKSPTFHVFRNISV